MEIAFGIACVILFLILVLGPALRRWFAPLLQRWMLGKMEDNMRRMAGMPTRKEEKKARRQARKMKEDAADRFRRAAGGTRTYGRGRYGRHQESPAQLLRYVAEDVEFTEIKEFSSEGEHHRVEYRVEEQIEDVEFTEYKDR